MKELPVQCETVNARTGKVERTQTVNWKIVPPPAGCCAVCSKNHEPMMPHDAQRLYYQYTFFAEHGRWPTWADAVAHCSDAMRSAWESELQKGGHWTQPPDGIAPIAKPYEEQT